MDDGDSELSAAERNEKSGSWTDGAGCSEGSKLEDESDGSIID